jgi:mono/diheme cytochrome c family protein
MSRLVTAIAVSAVCVFSSSAFAQGDVARGEKVYAAQKCQMCHAIAGKGNTKGPLDGVGSKLSADEIRQWIVDAAAMPAKTKAPRKPAMKSYPNIPKDDLDALVAYLHGLKK